MGKKREERAALRQVFKDTFEMWNEIALKGLKSKEMTGLAGKFKHDCPSCQYVVNKVNNGGWYTREDCAKYCPMYNLWPGGCSVSSSSPYYKWANCGHSPRQAKLIAFFAWEQI